MEREKWCAQRAEMFSRETYSVYETQLYIRVLFSSTDLSFVPTPIKFRMITMNIELKSRDFGELQRCSAFSRKSRRTEQESLQSANIATNFEKTNLVHMPNIEIDLFSIPMSRWNRSHFVHSRLLLISPVLEMPKS